MGIVSEIENIPLGSWRFRPLSGAATVCDKLTAGCGLPRQAMSESHTHLPATFNPPPPNNGYSHSLWYITMYWEYLWLEQDGVAEYWGPYSNTLQTHSNIPKPSSYLAAPKKLRWARWGSDGFTYRDDGCF